MLQLQTGHHENLSLVSVFPGGFRQEADVHNLLKAHRLTGEWFAPHAEVLAFAAQANRPDGTEVAVNPTNPREFTKGRYWKRIVKNERPKARRPSREEVMAIFLDLCVKGAQFSDVARKYGLSPETVGLIGRGTTHSRYFNRYHNKLPDKTYEVIVKIKEPQNDAEKNAEMRYFAKRGQGLRRVD